MRKSFRRQTFLQSIHSGRPVRRRPSARSLRLAAVILTLIVLTLVGSAAAARAHTVVKQAPAFRLRLDVRSARGTHAHVMPTFRAFKHAAQDGTFDSTTPLLQGSGPIMKEPTNYLIFWQPTGSTTAFPAGYEAAIQQFFQDVSGTPYLQIETQYCDKSGNCPTGISHYGGTWTDTNAYPGTDDGTTGNPLSDADMQQAVTDAIAANPSWNAPGTNTMYFVFTGFFTGTNPAEPIHSCMGSDCFAGLDTNQNGAGYCAYHGHFTSGGKDVIYSSQPEDALGACYPGSYNGGPYPNGAGNVDITLLAVSHEMFEANTDPDLANWRDTTGDEVGDKCAYHYPWGDPNAGPFEPDGTDIVLNGDPYEIQTEWSNGAVAWNQDQAPGQNPGAPGCVKRYSQDSLASIIPSSVDFGEVNAGDNATRIISIKNTGPGAMNVLSVRLGGGSSPRFSLANGTPTHATIAPGSSLSVTVRLDTLPFSVGPLSGSLIVDVDDPQPRYTYTIPLDATVGYPIATLNKSSIAFGGVATDDRTSPNTLTDTVVLSNTGSGPLTLFGPLGISGANAGDFAASSPVSLPATIAPGSQITLNVAFDPSAPGARSATLSVSTDDPFSPTLHVQLSGQGLVPALGFLPGSLVFAPTVLTTQVPGFTGSELDLGVTNTGQAELIVDSQTAAAPFSVPAAALPPNRYAPNTGYLLPVMFAPTAIGKFTGTVNVVDNGSAQGPVSGSVNVCGEGVNRGIRVLVVNGSGTPYATVTKLKLQSHNTSPGVNINTSDLALGPVPNSCVPGQQMQYENQSLPSAPGGSGPHASDYTLSVSVGGKGATQNFTLQASEFKEIVVTVK